MLNKQENKINELQSKLHEYEKKSKLSKSNQISRGSEENLHKMELLEAQKQIEKLSKEKS